MSSLVEWFLYFFSKRVVYSHFLMLIFFFFVVDLTVILFTICVDVSWFIFKNFSIVDRELFGRLLFPCSFCFLFEEMNGSPWFSYISKLITSKFVLGCCITNSISLAISGSTSIKLSSTSILFAALFLWDLFIRSNICFGNSDHMSLMKNSLSGSWPSR